MREVHAGDVHRGAAEFGLGRAHGRDQRLDGGVFARRAPLIQQLVEAAREDRHDRERPLAQPALQVEHLKLDRVLVAVRQLAAVGRLADLRRDVVDERGVAGRAAERRLEVLPRERVQLAGQVVTCAEDHHAQRRGRGLAQLEERPRHQRPFAVRIEVRRENRARHGVGGDRADALGGARRGGGGELLVEEGLQLGAPAGVGDALERGGPDLEPMVVGAGLGERAFVARRLEHEQLVELRDEVAHHVAHAQVPALLHHRGRDVVQRHRAVEQLQDRERLHAEHGLALDDAHRVLHDEQLALAVAHRHDLQPAQARVLGQVVGAVAHAARRQDDAGPLGGLGFGAGDDEARLGRRIVRGEGHGTPVGSGERDAGTRARSLTGWNETRNTDGSPKARRTGRVRPDARRALPRGLKLSRARARLASGYELRSAPLVSLGRRS